MFENLNHYYQVKYVFQGKKKKKTHCLNVYLISNNSGFKDQVLTLIRIGGLKKNQLIVVLVPLFSYHSAKKNEGLVHVEGQVGA